MSDMPKTDVWSRHGETIITTVDPTKRSVTVTYQRQSTSKES